MRSIFTLAVVAALNLACTQTEPKIFTNKNSSPIYHKVYQISELPAVPDFAAPIKESWEIRKFTLIKADCEILNFELKVTSSYFWKEDNTLTGFVMTDKKTKEKAVMTIEENGYELIYTDHCKIFKLQGKTDTDNKVLTDPLSILKNKLLTYARTRR